MKQITLIIIFLTALISIYSENVVIFADNNNPPYSFVKDNKLTGIYTIIIKEIFTRIDDYQLQLKPLPWKRGLSLLKEGRGFAIYPPYNRYKARPYMDYSEPILKETVVLFINKNSNLEVNRSRWPEDYYGFRIAQNLGYTIGGDEYDQAVLDKLIKEYLPKSSNSAILMLLNDRIDGYISDRLAMQYAYNQLKNGDCSPLIESCIISSEWGYLGITQNDIGQFSYKNDLLQKINNIITIMKENGEIDRIVTDFMK